MRVDRAALCSTAATSRALQPHQRCRLGIGRSYQIPQPFGDMTVFENLARRGRFGGGQSRERRRADSAREVLERTGLAPKRTSLPGR